MRPQYAAPAADYRTLMEQFARGGPVSWFDASAQRVEMVLRPAFAATLFLCNLGLQFVWAVGQAFADLLPADVRRQVRGNRAPSLSADSPLAFVLFIGALIFLVASLARPIVWPDPIDPRGFHQARRPLKIDPFDPWGSLQSIWDTGQSAISGWPGGAGGRAAPAELRVAGPIRPAGDYTLRAPPSLTPSQIDRILADYGSPATGTGEIWYRLGEQYGIDPAFAVAFFIHESSAGTNPGWAGIKPDGSTTHNVGNIICAGYSKCYNRFRDYPSWQEGIEDWYRLIDVEYIQGRGHQTVQDVIPIYAPAFENDVQGYVNAVARLVDGWKVNGVR